MERELLTRALARAKGDKTTGGQAAEHDPRPLPAAAGALAQQLDMDAAQVSEAGVAGLLHDIGEALMPAELLNSPGKLSRIDSTLLRDHPALGAETLAKQGLSPAWWMSCLHHHEKPDGSGIFLTVCAASKLACWRVCVQSAMCMTR